MIRCPLRRCAALACLVAAASAVAAGAVPADGAAAAAEARALLARGDAALALARIDAARRAAPDDVELRFQHGVALMDLEREPEAFDVFTQLTRDRPGLADPYNNLALLHARAGRLPQALQALQTALRNDPDHRAARVNLGQVHLLLAEQAWREATAADGPPDAALRRRLQALQALLAPAPTPLDAGR